MKLTVPHTYVEDRSQVVEIHTLAEVVKVQRSSTGFKTSTGTIRTCERCRGEKGVAGVEPWPVGTWLLIGEVFGDRRVISLVLCSDHFKELRNKEREIQTRGKATVGKTLVEMTFNPTFDSVGSPWVPVPPPE